MMNWGFYHYVIFLFIPGNFFALESTLCNIYIATPALFWLFAWYIFFNPSMFKLSTSLYLTWILLNKIFCLIQSHNLSLLFGVLRTFISKVIFDMNGFKQDFSVFSASSVFIPVSPFQFSFKYIFSEFYFGLSIGLFTVSYSFLVVVLGNYMYLTFPVYSELRILRLKWNIEIL